jgi:multidrug efflux pump subunit AcrA (membrane-fusion protein)
MTTLTHDHPSAAELAAFGLGQMDEGLAIAIEAHLTACATCRSAVDAAPADPFVAKVQDAFPTGIDVMQTRTLAACRVSTEIPAELAAHPRYRLIELLGAGGMGAVFKAEHLLMKRTVAVKVINRALFTDAAGAGRFSREMEAAGKLTHPNIVHAYDAEGIGATHFLAMEYVEGVSLAKLLAQRGPLPVHEACSYIRQAAFGLQHAHERGMVHRDIKPQNLMVTSAGQVKILDFGLARFVLETAPAGALLAVTEADADGNTPVEPLTQVGTVMGTPAYIAPEQARDPHAADIRADIYSLGCTLYELLIGWPPFPAGTARRKLLGHLHETPRSLSELRPEMPRALAQVVEKMLAKDPAQRYQTPAEVAAALVLWARDSNRPPAALAALGTKRSRRARLAYAASFAMIVGVLAYLFVPWVHDFAQTVVRVATDKGVLVIAAEDKDVEISIKRNGADAAVTARIAKGNKEVIELRAGDLTIEARLPGGDWLKTTELTLERGGKTIVTARFLLARPVLVSRPVVRTVSNYVQFAGRTDAAEAVNIKPRVSGYLQKVGFREGAYVQEGQVLFEIDSKPISAQIEQVKAKVLRLESLLKAKKEKAEDSVRLNCIAAKTELDELKLKLTYTQVRAPISGIIGRLYMGKGSLVIADVSMLSTIVSEDPMYVYFDVPEATALRHRALFVPKTELLMRLAGEDRYSHKVAIDFVNNQMHKGALSVRARARNPLLESLTEDQRRLFGLSPRTQDRNPLPQGRRLLTPGMSVRLRLPIGPAHRALLIKAPVPIGETRTPDFVCLVDDRNTVVRRQVKWGQEHDGLWVVTEGLQPDDRVIVSEPQLRPGDIVQPKLIDMPGSEQK